MSVNAIVTVRYELVLINLAVPNKRQPGGIYPEH